MATGRFKNLILGTGLSGTPSGDDITLAVTGAPPSGAAGGVLGGTYPNPSFAVDMATQAELDAHINDPTDAHDASAISIVDAGGYFTGSDTESALQQIGAAGGGGGGGAVALSYFQQCLLDNPTALWLLEDSGSPFVDTASNHNATMSGTVGVAGAALLTGLAHSAQFVPASSPLLTAADLTSLSPLTFVPFQLTVECVINFNNLPAAATWPVSKGGSTGAGSFEWGMSVSSTGQVAFFGWTSSGATIYSVNSGATVLSTGTTYHLAGTLDVTNLSTGGIKLYINAVDVTANAVYSAGTHSNTTGAVTIGRRGDASGTFTDARMQGVAVYPKVLSIRRFAARATYLI